MFELLTLAPRVLALTPRPDGIVAINDALGIGLMVDCAAGVQVPADISVIGIDNIALAGLAEPGLTLAAAGGDGTADGRAPDRPHQQ